MITIFKGSYRAQVGKKMVRLTRVEMSFLMEMAAGYVVGIPKLMEVAGVRNHGANSRPVSSHMCRLRKKVGINRIEVIFGVGYRLAEPATIEEGIHP